MKKAKKQCLSGPIIRCFRKQQEDETRNVTCPMCNSLVLYKNINHHLDNVCQKQTEDTSKSLGKSSLSIGESCMMQVEMPDIERTLYKDDLEEIGCKPEPGSLLNTNLDCDTDLVSNWSASKESQLELQNNQLAPQHRQLEPKHRQLELELEILRNEKEAASPIDELYLQNFMFIMRTVLSQKEDNELFNGSDNAVIESFQELSDESKTLYVRLFQRKYKWFQTSSIKYPRISENLQPCFEELTRAGFLHTEKELNDLTEILKLLSASHVQDLAKSLHIPTKAQSKKSVVEAMMKESKTQRSVFFTKGDNIQSTILKRAKTLLGLCVKLKSEPRNVFSRIILLFSLNLMAVDDDKNGNQLSSIFLTNIGKIVYPSYEISRHTAIFQDREDVISYDLASQDLCHIDRAIEQKDFDEARTIYYKVHAEFEDALIKLQNGDRRLIYSSKLPVHLRRFTALWLFTKMCSRGVELLQRNKNYDEAVQLLRQLLSQNMFCSHHRGRWWERLALNLDQHLKKPEEALNAVRDGLMDDLVRTGHRLALEQRAQKICKIKRNSSLKKHLTEMQFMELKEPSVVTISGKRLHNEPTFVLSEVNTDGSNDNEVVSFCGVEEMALRYYRRQGYNEGIHGEGLTFNILFTLLMWQEIFCDSVPDAFRTPFQAAPLDIYSENFYANRKEIIDKRLGEVENASVETLADWVKAIWLEHQGKTCVGVKWELFSGVQQIMGLVRCIGSKVIAGICERFAKDYLHTRSGLPDLVVWNCSDLKYKIVEVKGPNDKLSTKQQVWLDVLVRLGANAEVLYVKAVGGRRL